MTINDDYPPQLSIKNHCYPSALDGIESIVLGPFVDYLSGHTHLLCATMPPTRNTAYRTSYRVLKLIQKVVCYLPCHDTLTFALSKSFTQHEVILNFRTG